MALISTEIIFINSNIMINSSHFICGKTLKRFNESVKEIQKVFAEDQASILTTGTVREI